MIDIETLATSNDAALVSIAAVRFDLKTGIVGDSVYFKIDKQSCIDYGLRVDADTVDWWMKQGKEAQEQFLTTEDRVELHQALQDFFLFFEYDTDLFGLMESTSIVKFYETPTKPLISHCLGIILMSVMLEP